MKIILRITVILLVAGIVSSGIYALLGAPTSHSVMKRNEVSRPRWSTPMDNPSNPWSVLREAIVKVRLSRSDYPGSSSHWAS